MLSRYLLLFLLTCASDISIATAQQLTKNELDRLFVGSWIGNLEVHSNSGRILYQSEAILTRVSKTKNEVELILRNGDIVEQATIVAFDEGAVVLKGEHGLRRLEMTQEDGFLELNVRWKSRFKGRPTFGTATYRKDGD